jgi:hypothetical protein
MIRLLCAFVLTSCCLIAQPEPVDLFEPLQFLLGEWVGAGQGQPGGSSGGFTFEKDLDGKILIRRSRAVYPPTKDRAAFTHTDLTVIFESPAGLGATYFDNEGHRIQYGVVAAADRQSITFVSSPEQGQPRFRLTYIKEGDRVRVKFEIAPPGLPEAFKTYTEGVVTRRGNAGR